MTVDDIDVTAAKSSDIDTLVDLWVELATSQHEHGAHLLADANRQPIRESLASAIIGGEVLVAKSVNTESDDVVGFVMYHLETGAYEQDVTRGVIDNLFVKRECRGQEIGSRLLVEAERRLESRNCDTIALEVLARNDAARRFYRRHGYEPFRLEFEKSLGN